MKRIQRKRTKGWKMSPNTIYVGRPSKWGNPYSVNDYGLDLSLKYYRMWLKDKLFTNLHFLAPLEGKNLACWCPLNQPCHTDILLEVLRG